MLSKAIYCAELLARETGQLFSSAQYVRGRHIIPVSNNTRKIGLLHPDVHSITRVSSLTIQSEEIS